MQIFKRWSIFQICSLLYTRFVTALHWRKGVTAEYNSRHWYVLALFAYALVQSVCCVSLAGHKHKSILSIIQSRTFRLLASTFLNIFLQRPNCIFFKNARLVWKRLLSPYLCTPVRDPSKTPNHFQAQSKHIFKSLIFSWALITR